ncbi:TonB-dependent receptor, partial [Burkholderia cenocepacia]
MLLRFESDAYRRGPERGMPAPVAAVDAAGKPFAFALPSGPRATFFGAAGRDTIRDETMNWRSVFTQALDGDWELRHTLGVLALRSTFDNTYVTQSYAAKPRDYRPVQTAPSLTGTRARDVQTGPERRGKGASRPGSQHPVVR